MVFLKAGMSRLLMIIVILESVFESLKGEVRKDFCAKVNF